jgi:integrase
VHASAGEQCLQPLTLHNCRHTYASLVIAAGVSAKALRSYMDHSSFTTTYERYGHLMPDPESTSAAHLQSFIDGQSAQKLVPELVPAGWRLSR